MLPIFIVIFALSTSSLTEAACVLPRTSMRKFKDGVTSLVKQKFERMHNQAIYDHINTLNHTGKHPDQYFVVDYKTGELKGHPDPACRQGADIRDAFSHIKRQLKKNKHGFVHYPNACGIPCPHSKGAYVHVFKSLDGSELLLGVGECCRTE